MKIGKARAFGKGPSGSAPVRFLCESITSTRRAPRRQARADRPSLRRPGKTGGLGVGAPPQSWPSPGHEEDADCDRDDHEEHRAGHVRKATGDHRDCDDRGRADGEHKQADAEQRETPGRELSIDVRPHLPNDGSHGLGIPKSEPPGFVHDPPLALARGELLSSESLEASRPAVDFIEVEIPRVESSRADPSDDRESGPRTAAIHRKVSVRRRIGTHGEDTGDEQEQPDGEDRSRIGD
jgi:hypothetical protein